MGLFEFMNENKRDAASRTKAVTCADGFKVSIQASSTHYSEPQKDLDDYSDYSQFELGFPSWDIKELAHHTDDDYDIYAYVPKEKVLKLVEDHGGLAS